MKNDQLLDKVYKEGVIRSSTLADIIKRFFWRMAGRPAYQLIEEAEIPIPAKYSTGKIKSVLQSIEKNSDSSYGTPKQEELDLFRTKVVSLLQDCTEVPFRFEEAIALVKKCPITYLFEEGSYLTHESVVHLKQTISPLPGVEVEASGSFQRDLHHRKLTLPLRESFQLQCHTFQTGFCHPLQYVGLAWHEKLLPSTTVSPQFHELLKKRDEIAKALYPGKRLYNKARGLIKQKCAIFSDIGPQIALLEAHHIACDDTCEVSDDTFETFSAKARAFAQNAFGTPISTLQESRHPIDEYTKLYLELAKPEPLYSKKTAQALIRAGLSIHLMQPLLAFERTVLISLIRQQLIFIYELEELTPNRLEEHVLQVIDQERSLFITNTSNDRFTKRAAFLADELINYYSRAIL